MNERIDYEKQCILCKWTDNTQAQCFCGHLQNIAGCKSFERDKVKPEIKDLKMAALKLNMLMRKARIARIVMDSDFGGSFEANAGLLEAEIHINSNGEEII